MLVESLRLAIKENGGPDCVARIRMCVEQRIALECESIRVVSIVQEKVDAPIEGALFDLNPRTFGGIPIVCDRCVPEDAIVLEDHAGETLHVISGLPVPQPYSSDQE